MRKGREDRGATVGGEASPSRLTLTPVGACGWQARRGEGLSDGRGESLFARVAGLGESLNDGDDRDID